MIKCIFLRIFLQCYSAYGYQFILILYNNGYVMKKEIWNMDVKVTFRDEGQGTPVVFLHGYLESSEIWHSFTRGLSGYGRIISIDLPGHGESGVAAEVHTMEFMADVVQRVLDHLAVEQCILVGHSMGGYVALAFLEAYADRLKALSLFHSHPLADTPETRANREREIELVREGKKELICNVNIPKAFATDNLEKYRDEVGFAREIAHGTPGPGIIAVLKGMMKRHDYRETLSNCPVPFLWILGKKDNYIDYEAVLEKVTLPEKGTLTLLDHSGHMGFIEEKEKSSDIMMDFILMNQQRS
jgi:pimeloyl-ACP methyl ester carboxylesterase